MEDIRTLILNLDLKGLREALSGNPDLANEGLPLENNPVKAHPLHRLCDGVFAKKYSDDEAVEMAKIFLEYGANVNGNEMIENRDTPLVAAASLHSDKLGMLYIEHGADINHPGCHGGTALHWAAWCGRDLLVKKLIEAKASINKICHDFKSTPLLWAVHGYKFGGEINRYHQPECVRLLLGAGADKTIPNAGGRTPLQLLAEEIEMINLLS